jgi:hypothetical protein
VIEPMSWFTVTVVQHDAGNPAATCSLHRGATDLEGVITHVICPEYEEPTGICRLKRSAEMSAPLSRLLERVSEDTLETHTNGCDLAVESRQVSHVSGEIPEGRCRDPGSRPSDRLKHAENETAVELLPRGASMNAVVRAGAGPCLTD